MLIEKVKKLTEQYEKGLMTYEEYIDALEWEIVLEQQRINY